jgi:molybdopterin-containing oxidoreductase family iron-sulfur binding subunit
VGRAAGWEGTRAAFGRPLDARFDLRAATTLLAVGSDPLTQGPGFVPRARAFADGRRIRHEGDAMNRLYVADAALTSTGALADHRLFVPERDLTPLLAAIAARVIPTATLPADLRARFAGWRGLLPEHARWIDAVARDLGRSPGDSAVLVGDRMSTEAHAIAGWINAALGNVGRTVTFVDPPIFEAGQPSHDPSALPRALASGIDVLVVLGGNPAYTSFADVGFATVAAQATTSVYLGAYRNETARACRWFVPLAHGLEAWGDGRATDGTVSFVQPLLRRRGDARTIDEVLAVFAGDLAPDAHALLRAHWSRARPELASNDAFRAALGRGLLDGTALPPVEPALDLASLGACLRTVPAPTASGLELRFAVDPRVHDGRFADNAWLLELPDPVTSLTWDNAALLSRATAAKLGVATGKMLELTLRGRSLRAPALVTEHADESITLSLGYGSDRLGDEGDPERAHREGEETYRVGVNAYALRTSGAPWFDGGLAARAVTGDHELAFGQEEHDLHGRDDDILMHRTLAELRAEPGFAERRRLPPRQLYLLAPNAERQWGMAVDLNACVGCSACVVACQAENNVPVVGKLGVRKGRRMHWLRLDRYTVRRARTDALLPQPMLCQHCETAPCEYVCPVNATNHSDDGLNQMIYNRCVGTRFCSNNCPYKVRRFNWFDYNLDLTPVEQLVKNPDVTVRERGVMEKCTYCVQRIREREIDAAVSGRPIADGEIRTACQQVCPAHAITFGNLADGGSEVARWSEDPRTFNVLNDLGTRPRTRYLAKVFNPNPELS